MTICIPPNIKNSKWTGFLSSKLSSDRTGSSFSNTINGNTTNLSDRFREDPTDPSLKTSSALSVALLIITSMIIMAATANISVRSVDRLSPAGNMSPLPSVSSVPTAAIPLSRKRTGSFSASTNVSTRTALFISIISKKWKTNICCPLTEDQDINFTISIGNLPWISFAWILTPSLSLYHILTTPFFPYGIPLYFLFYPYLYLIIIIYQLLSNGKNYLEIKCFFVKKRC